MRLRVATWNVGNRAGSWQDVAGLGCDVVLLQEAPAGGVPEGSVFQRHQRETRRFGTAIWRRDGGLQQLPATTSAEEGCHRGAAVVAEVVAGDAVLTLISLHFVDDRISRLTPGSRSQATSNGYAVTTAHRVLSDLTGYLDDRRRRRGRNVVVLGGDLNINPGWDQRQNNASHQLVLDRLGEFGLRSVLPIKADDSFATCVRRGRPVPHPQIDYLFVSENVRVLEAEVDASDRLVARGDHLPIVADLQTA